MRALAGPLCFSSGPSSPSCPPWPTPPGAAMRFIASSSPGSSSRTQPPGRGPQRNPDSGASHPPGLPPTLEVDAFLADTSDGAYELRRPAPRLPPPIWRTHGLRLARCRPLRRHQRLPARHQTLHVAMARLGHPRLQRTRPSTSSPSNNWPATCSPTPRSPRESPPASTGTTASTAKAASFRK